MEHVVAIVPVGAGFDVMIDGEVIGHLPPGEGQKFEFTLRGGGNARPRLMDLRAPLEPKMLALPQRGPTQHEQAMRQREERRRAAELGRRRGR